MINPGLQCVLVKCLDPRVQCKERNAVVIYLMAIGKDICYK